jgi:hypothetical protein
MAGQLKRLSRSQRNRRGLVKGDNRLALSLVASTIEFTTPDIDATFPTPVVLKGIPQWLTDTGKLPTAATKTAPNKVNLVYDTPGSVTTVTVPERDPALRSHTGGYAAPGTFPAT